MPATGTAPVDANLTYDDLTLRLGPSPSGEGFFVQVLASPSSRCPVIALKLPEILRGDPRALLADLERVVVRSAKAPHHAQRDVTVFDADEPAGARAVDPLTIGAALFDALFAGALRELFLTTQAAIRQHTDRAVRIRLRLDPERAGRLAALPWELLYQSETRSFLSRETHTPVVRHLEVAQPSISRRPVERLRVLVALSNPSDVTPLDVAREKRALEAALGSRPAIELRFLEAPTLEKLRDQVRDQPFDVLHFVGHGGIDERGAGILHFENGAGRSQAVTGELLATNLKDRQAARLVFLNACESARLPRSEAGIDPYHGVASALIVGGIPAVVAMQFPISDHAAIAFSERFYARVAAGDSLESAMVEGRIRLASQPSSWEWVTPVLLLGVNEGAFFAPASDPGPDRAAPAPAPDPGSAALERGRELLDLECYGEAVEALSAVAADSLTPQALFDRALARLAGLRPRSAKPAVIKSIESDLAKAGRHTLPAPAHVPLLHALVKHDFYRMNGLRLHPPTPDDLIAEAQASALDAAELESLLDRVRTPDSPIRQAISELLESARS